MAMTVETLTRFLGGAGPILYDTAKVPVFHEVKTTSTDGTPRETHFSLILGSSEADNGRYERTKIGKNQYRGGYVFNKDARTQSEWQEFYLRRRQELPSLPVLVATFIQIRDALYGKDPMLQGVAEEFRDDLRRDYKGGSLPTSTRVVANNSLVHRVGTSSAYELPFKLPQIHKLGDLPGVYELIVSLINFGTFIY